MNDVILHELIAMIEQKVGRRNPITRDSALENDICMTGDDAVEFLLEYSKKYNVDLTGFDIRKFTPEGDTILGSIINNITGREGAKVKELTVGMLEHGVAEKWLADDMI